MANFSAIAKNVGSFAGKIALKVKEHTPEILLVGGIAGTVIGTVLGCKATVKAKEVVKDVKEDMAKIAECAGDEGLKESGDYTDEDAKQDTIIVYTKAAMRFVKLYAPAVIIGTLSIVSLFTSHGIMRKRTAALAAAYTAVDASFKAYRGRVVNKYGQDVDNELMYHPETIKVDEIEVDAETGKEKKVKKTVEVLDPELDSPYAVYFDKRSRNFEGDRDYDLFFLRSQQNLANDKLRTRKSKVLFLNEVLDDLDLPRVQMGQLVGWRYDPDDPDLDNYVDFRIREVYRRTENGDYEPAILLDFNVGGYVLDGISKKTV